MKVPQAGAINILDQYDDVDMVVDDDDTIKRVELQMLEWDWVFRGEQSIKFIEMLSKTENTNLFDLEAIRVVVTFMWDKFYYRLRNRIFFPFLFYFFVYIYFVSSKLAYKRYEELSTLEDAMAISSRAILAISILWFTIIEIQQAMLGKGTYWGNPWNYLDLCSLMTNTFVLIFSSINFITIQSLYTVASVSTLIMWMKLFYFLRLFSATAGLIRLIN